VTIALDGSRPPATAGTVFLKEHRTMQVFGKSVPLPPYFPRLRSTSGPAAYPIAGASLGLVTFLVVGLLPSLLLGGSAGAQVASELGSEGSHGYGVNALLVLGVLAATTVGALLFAARGEIGRAHV